MTSEERTGRVKNLWSWKVIATVGILGQSSCSVTDEYSAAMTLGLIPPVKLESADQYIGWGTLGVEFRDATGAWLRLKFEDNNDPTPEDDKGALFLSRGTVKNPKGRRRLRSGCREAQAAALLLRRQVHSWYSDSEIEAIRSRKHPPYDDGDPKAVAAWFEERIAKALETY